MSEKKLKTILFEYNYGKMALNILEDKMKRSFILILLFISVLALTGCGDNLSRKEYTIATCSKSGVYYPIGEALNGILKEQFPDVTIKVIETAGSVDNIQMLKEGKVDMALVQNDIAYYACNGEAMFEGNKVTNISGIATLFPEVIQFIVRKDSNVTNLSELAGKKIAIGGKNSGTRYNVEQILGAAGVFDKVTCINIDVKEAIEKIKTKDIDGFVFTSGLPNPSIVELSKSVEIVLLPVDLELIQKLINKYSFYFPSTIAPQQYSGQTQELNGLEINAILVSGSTLSEDDQYLLTKYLFNKPNELGQAHPRLSKMTKNSLRQQMPIPLGKGAHKAHMESAQQ